MCGLAPLCAHSDICARIAVCVRICSLRRVSVWERACGHSPSTKRGWYAYGFCLRRRSLRVARRASARAHVITRFSADVCVRLSSITFTHAPFCTLRASMLRICKHPHCLTQGTWSCVSRDNAAKHRRAVGTCFLLLSRFRGPRRKLAQNIVVTWARWCVVFSPRNL